MEVSRSLHMFFRVLRIRDVYPGSDFFHTGSRIHGRQDPGSQIRIRKKRTWVSLSQKQDPGCSSQIPDLDIFPSRIHIQGSKRHRIPVLWIRIQEKRNWSKSGQKQQPARLKKYQQTKRITDLYLKGNVDVTKWLIPLTRMSTWTAVQSLIGHMTVTVRAKTRTEQITGTVRYQT